MGTKYSLEIKNKIIEIYKNEKKSLRKLGKEFGINYKTIWRWLKEIEKIKEEKKLKEIEEKIVFLKENKPDLTILEIEKIFKNEKIYLSKKFIWKKLKEYGLLKEKNKNVFFAYSIKLFKSIEFQKEIKNFIKKKKIFHALNNIEVLINQKTKSNLENYINLRTGFEAIKLLWGKIPVERYYKFIKYFEKIFRKRNWNLCYILCLFEKLYVFHWKKDIDKGIRVINSLTKYIKKIKDPELKFMFYFYKASFFSYKYKMEIAKNSLIKCSKIIYILKSPFYYKIYGDLLSYLEEFKKAKRIYEKVLKIKKDDKAVFLKLCSFYLLNGEYKKAEKMIKIAEKREIGLNAIFFEIKGIISFVKGNVIEAINYFQKALEIAEKEDLKNHLHISTFNLACCYQALKEERKAKEMLRKYLYFFKKYNLKRESSLREILLNKKNIKPYGIFSQILYKFKNIKNKKDFYDIFKKAENKGIKGIIHRFVVFYPEILPFINKNKFPPPILNFPIFIPYIPGYKVEFLKKFKIMKNGKKLNLSFSRKEKKFLIFLSINQEKLIPLKNVYSIFENKVKNPYFSLLQLVNKLRKILRIPSSFLRFKRKEKEKYLYSSIPIYSDYHDFNFLLSEAKVFLKLGKIEEAKKKFLKAFSLIKSEPFKNMYDRFSEDKRTEIIFKIKDAYEDFLKTNPSKKEIEKLRKKFEKLKILIK
jgi:tetratricopeptide (TPR) repeat protein